MEPFIPGEQKAILTPEEVAQYLRKSPSWVYKHWQGLGGVKLGGSLFFPSKEDLYEHLFCQGQRLVPLRLRSERGEVQRDAVQNQESGARRRSRKKEGIERAGTEPPDNPGRHGLFGLGEPEA